MQDAVLWDEYVPAESAAEEMAWDMDVEYEADEAWEINGAYPLQSYSMEPAVQAKTSDLPAVAFTATPQPTLMPQPTSTSMPTFSPTPQPQPTVKPTEEPMAEPTAEPPVEPEETETPEAGEKAEAPETSRPKQWIGWIALGVGGVLALVVLATKQIREKRKRKNK